MIQYVYTKALNYLISTGIQRCNRTNVRFNFDSNGGCYDREFSAFIVIMINIFY